MKVLILSPDESKSIEKILLDKIFDDIQEDKSCYFQLWARLYKQSDTIEEDLPF